MILRGINFGPVLGASGVQGFFGEGYWFHRYMRPIGLDFEGMTFVAKTTTLEKRQGNMPLADDGITPTEKFPKCVKVNFFKGIVLNSVGLSGPGAEALFKTGQWQQRTKPFFISFMSIEKTADARARELRKFVTMFRDFLPDFRVPVGLQINFSCPNVGLETGQLVGEVRNALETASILEVPLMPKFNVLVKPETVKTICDDSNCDAICISNTIPWGKFSQEINWKKLFGSDTSPLEKIGGGGLSGKPLLKLVLNWLSRARNMGIKKPINAGGGILSSRDVCTLYYEGASSVFLGSVASLRPWRVKKIIKTAHQLFKKGNAQ